MMEQQTSTWPVIGHKRTVELLARSVQRGQVGHAYLISGPEGIGRRTLALAFARALLCTASPDARPCEACSSCRRTMRGIHPDLTRISLETQSDGGDRQGSKNTRVSIETIRDLRGSIALRPLEAPWRVAILEDVDRFSRDAYDALLKTLEEPPRFVVLLLIATEVETVPETIRSRCRQVALEPLTRREVTEALVAQGVGPERAAMVASVTRGRIGHAIALAADEESLAARREAVEAGLEMIQSRPAALGSARRLSDLFRRGQRVKVEAELDLLLGLWRDLLLLASDCPDHVVNADFQDQLAGLARRWSQAEIGRALKATYDALSDLAANVQPRLALANMVMQWPD